MADLSIIIVNWNVCDLLRRCLTSVQSSPGVRLDPATVDGAAAPGGTLDLARPAMPAVPAMSAMPSVEVVVVDNASGDGSVEMLRREFPWVRVIANAENRGFTAANNQGMAVCAGRYLMLLNPDTELLDDALKVMLDFMEAHPAVGLLGPQLRYAPQTDAVSAGDPAESGGVQSSRRRFPTLATALVESTVLQGLFQGSQVLRRYYLLDAPDDIIQEVDWVVGAAMMVRRPVVEQVGGLDQGFFMYSEELDWCRRIKAAPAPGGDRWQVMYLPAARVVHHEGRSSAQAPALKQIQFHASKVRYFGKYHGWPAAQALRVFLLGTYVYQIMEESAKWLVGHKRPLRAQRLSIYWQVLRSGLRPRGTQ
jgi:N-acetylglucosaminyl-diphospho-decaprenol L-rhamnosyltransferase